MLDSVIDNNHVGAQSEGVTRIRGGDDGWIYSLLRIATVQVTLDIIMRLEGKSVQVIIEMETAGKTWHERRDAETIRKN